MGTPKKKKYGTCPIPFLFLSVVFLPLDNLIYGLPYIREMNEGFNDPLYPPRADHINHACIRRNLISDLFTEYMEL